MQHIVMYSGGIGSWATAKRVIQQVGPKRVILLWADTKIEDDDLYRFLDETVREMGVNVVRLADGRTPWQVFRDERYIGNSRVDPCSKILKRNLCSRWLAQHCNPEETIVYLGIDWTEMHRYERAIPYWKPWTIRAPLCEEPYWTKLELFVRLEKIGIKPPRLYDWGFSHNNCGGFCVKAGQAQFRLLLRTLPDRYAEHERQEEELRQYLGKDVAILRRTVKGKAAPLTLRQLRREVEEHGEGNSSQEEDWGGCGCFVDV